MEKKLLEIIKEYKTDVVSKENPKVFSTGSFLLDRITGIGGYPQKRIIEIYGQPSTGKTTLAIYAIKSIQSVLPEKKIVYLDIERTLNLEYVKKCGVKAENLVMLRPKNAEETFNLIIDFLKTNLISLIIVDSVAALLPQKEEGNKMENDTIGLQARLMSKALRKINYLLSERSATIIFINQTREKIKKFFGTPETTSGGNALKFYASLRIQLRRGSTTNSKKIGFITHAKIIKNKLAPPFQTCELEFIYNHGIRKEWEIIKLGLEEKIITKKGNWFWYNEYRLGLGYEQVSNFFLKEPNVRQSILKSLKLL